MTIPENLRDEYIAKKMPSLQQKNPQSEVVEVEQEETEIRTVDNKEYIIHKIKPGKDTTFSLSLKYKVSE